MVTYRKSRFRFPKAQQSGILFLIISLLFFLALKLFWPKPEPSFLVEDSTLIRQITNELDSLSKLKTKEKPLEIYPFNPNFLNNYRAYVLGLDSAVLQKVKAYRDKDQWINSSIEFQNITGISDSVLKEITPYFKFPEWVSNQNNAGAIKRRQLPPKIKKNINTATAVQLQKVYGIGTVLSKRIIDFRNKLGGFSDPTQLNLVYGLDTATQSRLWTHFSIENPTPIIKKNINTLSSAALAEVPGINYQLATEIWKFIRLRKGIDSLSQLRKIPEITAHTYTLITLYLYVE